MIVNCNKTFFSHDLIIPRNRTQHSPRYKPKHHVMGNEVFFYSQIWVSPFIWWRLGMQTSSPIRAAVASGDDIIFSIRAAETAITGSALASADKTNVLAFLSSG